MGDRSERDTANASEAGDEAVEGAEAVDAPKPEGFELDVPDKSSRAPTAEEVIEALTEELEELENRHLRVAAEFDNFRKRTLRERAQHTERAQAELVKGLLESLDDLSRVSELGSVDHDAAALLEGIQLVEAKLRRALQQQGLDPIEAVGRPFNPEYHDALVTVSTDEPEEDGLVSQEMTKGYMFKDTLLRPSLVEVKVYQPAPEDEAGEAG